MNQPKRALTGIRASGNIHLGNYLGTMRPAFELTKTHECFFFVADMHALTTNRDPAALRAQSLDMVAIWLAMGLDTSKHLLYRQSDLPYVAEAAWYLSCTTGLGLIEKSHAYKDALQQGKDVSHGVFSYPVLMAADILLYNADVVPVGKDQKQHVEMARDMAQSFNAAYGQPILKLPTPLIQEEVMVIPGLDGRKMSKSYGNEIPLMIDEKGLRKLVMTIKTDSSPLEAPKTLAGTLTGDLFKLFAVPQQYHDLEARLLAGGLGWGHAKEELFVAINDHVKEIRSKFLTLRADEAALNQVLDSGAARAFKVAEPVLNAMRSAIGFRNFRGSYN